MDNLSFIDWYQQKFRNGHHVAEYFFSDISETAERGGINWTEVQSEIKWISGHQGKFNANHQRYKANGNKNSVGIYASMSRTDSGAEFPVITFTQKGEKAGAVVFNGYQYLLEEYERDGHGQIDPEKKEKWEREKAKREREIEKKREKNRRKHEADLKRNAQILKEDLENHFSSPRATIETVFKYTDDKLIRRIFDHLDIRLGTDRYGKYISIVLQNIKGELVGVQKIYEKIINGKGTNKLFTPYMVKSGAHFVIGDLSKATRKIAVEGFATGSSAYLAYLDNGENIAVIVCLDAGNMIKVVNAYIVQDPDIDIDLGLDNDLWQQKRGKGNKGLLVGMKLLSQHNEIKAYYPNFDKYDPSFNPTDWNDLQKQAGLNEVYKQLKGTKNRLKLIGDPFEIRLAMLRNTNKDHIGDEVKEAVKVGLNIGITKYRPSDVIALIKLNTEHAKDKIDIRKLREYAGKIFKAKVKSAQKFRQFSSKYTNPQTCPSHVTYKKFNKSVVDKELYDHIMGLNGIVICRIPMGGGKTQFLIKPALHSCNNAAVFCHRTSLVGGSHEVFNTGLSKGTDDVVHYQERYAREMLGGGGKLAACINSCLKTEFNPVLNNLDGLFIDEASQTLRHTCAGGAIKYPVAVFKKTLDMMVNTTDHIILTDADANDTLVDFCELALKRRNEKLKSVHGDNFQEEKIHIIDGVTDCSNINIYHTDNATAFIKATNDVIDGKRVLIANDSADDADKLFAYLQRKAPDKKGLLVTMETKSSKEYKEFSDSPDRVSKKYDYIIYSPSISSGVSITNGHFNRHYGIFCGTVAPSDAIQMIRRDRKATNFILGLTTRHSSRETNPMNMWLSMLLVNDNNLDIELDKDKGAILLKTQDLEFDRFRIELITQENRAKNDFANNMLMMLWDDGYKINYLETEEIEKERGKIVREEASEEIKNQYIARHLNQSTPNEGEARLLRAKNDLSKDEKARLNRLDIESKLMMPVTDESIMFVKRGGLRKVALMELLRMSPDQAMKYDQAEKDIGIQPSNRTYAYRQQKAIRDYFEIAGIDWKTGEGTATKESLAKAAEHLVSGDMLHVFNNVYKFGGFIKSGAKVTPFNVFKNISQSLGLKAESTQIGRLNTDSSSRIRYFLNSDLLTEMLAIQERRIKHRISAWKVEKLDGAVIHNPADNYKEEPALVDHADVNKNALCTWKEAIKHALNTCNIPLKNGARVVAKLLQRGEIKQNGHTYESIVPANEIYEKVAETLGEMTFKDFDFTT